MATQQFYRKDKDIYNASTNEKIGATDWNQNWSGKATELSAINGAQYNTKELQQQNFSDIKPIGGTLYGVQKTQNLPKVDTQVLTPEAPKAEAPAVTTPQIFDKEKIKGQITETATNNLNTVANQALIDAAFRVSRGRNATDEDKTNVAGKTVGQVLEMTGLSDLAPNMGLDKPEDVNKSQDGVIKVEPPKPTTLEDRITSYQNQVEGIKSAKAESTQLSAKESAALKAKSEIDQMYKDMEINKIFDIEKDNIRGEKFDEIQSEEKKQGLLRSTINMRLNENIEAFNLETSQMNREELLKNATQLYAYNTKVTQYNLLKGEAELARASVEESADNFLAYRQMAVDDMERQGAIDRQEKADLSAKNDMLWEKEANGYVPIAKENYEAMVREYGENRIYTDAYGDSYLKPDDKIDATDFVGDIMARYPDAGVLPTDTIEVAQSKISNSKIYRQQTGQDTQDSYQFVSGSDNTPGGVFNKSTGQFQLLDGTGGGNVATSTGEIYDIGSYATDPNHEIAIQGILNKMGQFKTVEDIDNYIKQVSPDSPITGEMVRNASEKHGVSWEMITAIMQQDSSLGTAGIGARNFNPGNIAQFDSLGTTPTAGYKSWQEGVDAVAKNLAWRKQNETPIEQIDQEVNAYVQQVKDGKLTDLQALQQIDKDKKGDLVNELAKVTRPTDSKDDLIAKDKINLSNSLKTHEGLNSAVGTSFIDRGNKLNWYDKFSGATQDFIGKTEKLLSGLSLDSLIDAKGRGATFGALSDSEMQILSSAASTIGTWRMTDKYGKVTGYNIDEDSFRDEIDNINKVINRSLKSSIESYGEFDQNDPLGLNIDDNTSNSTNPLSL